MPDYNFCIVEQFHHTTELKNIFVVVVPLFSIRISIMIWEIQFPDYLYINWEQEAQKDTNNAFLESVSLAITLNDVHAIARYLKIGKIFNALNQRA